MVSVGGVKQLVNVAVGLHHALVLGYFLAIFVSKKLFLCHEVVKVPRSLVKDFDVSNLVKEARDKLMIDLRFFILS